MPLASIFIVGGDLSLRDRYVNELYNLEEYEVSIIEDAITYLHDYFSRRGKSFVFSEPSKTQFFQYGNVITDILRNTFGKPLIHSVCYYVSNAPMAVVVLLFDSSPVSTEWIDDEDSLDSMLEQLNTMLVDRHQNVYIRRNVRIYGKDAIYIVKPKQKKYWNYSAACRDADEIFADIMNRKEE